MTNGLEIVTPRLLVADMGVDRRIAGRASQILALTEGDVLALGVFELLSQAKIDDVNVIFSSFAPANQEVVRLDITMDYPLLVHLLNAAYLYTISPVYAS